ncbi:MAG: ECF-type sigma factor [Longimicrobiales bacterium]
MNDDEAVSLDEFYRSMQERLRRMARFAGAREGETLNPTALIQEAYLKLAAAADGASRLPEHHLGLSARAMRHIVIDEARRKSAKKRGGDAPFVTLGEHEDPASFTTEEVLALEEALEELAAFRPRQAQVVEMKFFGGFTNQEMAQQLGTSVPTVEREWKRARAWLGARLSE